MENLSLYHRAHLVVAAIRLIEYQTGKPPGIDQLCEPLSASPEQVYMICRKLAGQGIIDMVERAEGDKLFISDHLKIEDVPDESSTSGMEEELALFQQKQKERDKKIQEMKSKEEERKKKLFDEIEKKIKGTP